MTSPVLQVERLSVALPRGADRAHAVSAVSFEVEQGQLSCLVGESGSGKSIIAHLNPLHMQTFDRSAMVRALAANGFEVTFIKARNSSFLVLARAVAGKVAWEPISPAKLAQRIADSTKPAGLTTKLLLLPLNAASSEPPAALLASSVTLPTSA